MQNLSPFAAQKALFRAYDIRGTQCYFTQGFVQALAQAFAQLYTTQCHNANSHTQNQTQSSPTVIIGYDVRHGSDCIAQTVANTLQASGLKVIHLGLVTTPMAAFWAQQYDGHGIMVTASHSAKETLGIKWLVHNASPSHSEIQALYQQIANHKLDAMIDSHHQDEISTTDLPADTIANTYIEAMVQVISAIHPADKRVSNHKRSKDSLLLRNVSQPALNLENKLDLTLVIDCLSGATSNIAKPLFERFCQRVIMLNDRPDGSFPTGNPDPTEPNRLAELQQTVIINSADMGLAFDGDGDRLMIVDNSGKVVTPDHLLYLLAQVAITERQLRQDTTDDDKARDNNHAWTAPPVLFDVKCSHHLAQLLTALGAQPIMTRTGSSLLRQQLQTDQKQAIFAGELSGHFIFNDGYFIVYDDAMYAGLRLLHWLAFTAVPTAAQTDKIMLTTDLWGALRSVLPPYALTDITQNLPTLVSTADHYLPLPKTQACETSVLEHLIAYCCYLQDFASAHRASTKVDGTKLSPIDFSKNSVLCSCFNDSSSTNTETHLPISHLYNISIEQAQQLIPEDTQISLIDGVRLDFANGFGVLRESNTSHSLTVRFAGDSIKDLQEVQARFVALCELFDSHLAQQVAAIGPE
ncbi:phosphomannomutase [Psychrobacter sp. 1U2]|uniref:phosphomannomutase n=1 Tax=Psychrobacter sp. 1U2 TaxID=3453577 RepID=UPI003F47999F